MSGSTSSADSPPKSSVPSPSSRSPTSRLIWATNPKTESTAPADTALVGVEPERWKNRMLIATRAALDGTARLMKQVANVSLVTRPQRHGRR